MVSTLWEQEWSTMSDETKTYRCIRTGGAGGPAMDVGIEPIPFEVHSRRDDAEAWEQFLRDVVLGGPMPCRFEAHYNSYARATVIAMTMKTIDRASADEPWWAGAVDGEPHQMSSEPLKGATLKTFIATSSRILFTAQPPTLRPIETDGLSMRWIRALAREAWLHELDEFLLYKGARRFDPHRDLEMVNPYPYRASKRMPR